MISPPRREVDELLPPQAMDPEFLNKGRNGDPLTLRRYEFVGVELECPSVGGLMRAKIAGDARYADCIFETPRDRGKVPPRDSHEKVGPLTYTAH